MQPHGQNIYATNIPPPNNSSANVNIILLGDCGVGKSRLLNNLCLTHQKVGISRGSVTDGLFWAKAVNMNLGVVDTPGINKNNTLTSLTLRRGLRSLDWNLVVVMAKLDSRFEDNTLTRLQAISKPFRNDMDRVVFVISHLDLLDQESNITTKQQTLASLAESLGRSKLHQPVIVISNENSDFHKLSQILHSIGSQCRSAGFQFDDKQFCRSLGFETTADNQQKLIFGLLQNLAQKLQSAKSKNHQISRVDAEQLGHDEIHAFLSKFADTEQKSVSDVISCFLDIWLDSNIVKTEEPSPIKPKNDVNQSKHKSNKNQEILTTLYDYTNKNNKFSKTDNYNYYPSPKLTKRFK